MTDIAPPADRTGRLSPAKQALLQRRLAGGRSRADADVSAIEQVDPALPVAVSPAQRGLWIQDRYLEGNALYSANEAMWLHGRLHLPALRTAVDRLVERHEALRTVFPGTSEPLQMVRPPRPGGLKLLTLGGKDRAECRDRARELARQEVATPFDLAAGPLFRVLLITVADDEHLLVLNMHHIVTDGWSFDVLARDLAEFYSAAAERREAVLPGLRVNYRSFSAWQLGRQDPAGLDGQLAYWRGALEDVAPVLDLPTDRPRPPRQSYRGAAVTGHIAPETAAGVRALAAARGTTVFATLLATFQVLLHRYTGQPKFAVGTLLHGRGHAEPGELDDVVGLFASTAALPADLGDRPRFDAFLARTRLNVIEAIAHQDVPFDRVVEELAPPRDLSRNPLFQTLYQHLEPGEKPWTLTGLTVEPTHLGTATSKVDLGLFTTDRGAQGMRVDLVFATDLFDTSTARRILDHFLHLVGSVVADPHAPVDTLEILPAEETGRILRDWNATESDYPTDRCLHELFEEQVARTPDAAAVVTPDGTVSYAQLNARANQVAHLLREQGVRPDVFVGLCVRHSVEMFVGILGILKAGGAYVPLDPDHPADRLAYVLEDTAAPIVLTQDAVRDRVPGTAAQVIRLDGDRPARYPEHDPGRTALPGDLVYAIYTSGSTGRPKGVLITHRGLNNYLVWAVRGYGLEGSSGAPMLGSIAFDLSVPNFLLPFIGGRDVTLLPEDRSLEGLAELLRRPGDFSLLKITPAHLDVLRAHLDGEHRTEGPVTSVRTFVVGADEVKPETAAAWQRIAPGARMINEYGPTETVVGCSVYEIPADGAPRAVVPIGRPIANTQMYVLDDHLRPVPPGVTGELYIGGDGVARGYLNRPALTAEKFLPDPYSPTPGARFYRTGDRARFRPDGNLEFLGRIDHQVKIRGYRIEPGEVETALLLHPSIAEAVVAVREDKPGERRLVGYVVPTGTEGPGPAELRDFLRQSLPEYLVPAIIVSLGELPLSNGGKVDRRLLPPPAGLRGETTAPSVPPGDGPERILADIWADVLGLDHVGAHDNFFDAGGDSLLALRVVARAREAGLALRPRTLFECQTLARLADAATPCEPSDPLPRAGEHAPQQAGEMGFTPLQRWFLEAPVDRAAHVATELVEIEWTPAAVDLEAVLHRLTAHHEALRLRLDHGPDGTPRLRPVAREESVLLREMDLTGTAPEQWPAETRRTAAALVAGIDPAQGPLLQAALLRTGTGTDRLLLAVHHLGTDGVSWRILMDDLSQGWRRLRDHAPAEPPAPTVPVSTWTRALAGLAASGAVAGEAEFWERQDAASSLPVDVALGRNSTASSRTVTHHLPGGRTETLVARAGRGEGTVAQQLLAALALAVAEEGTGDDVLVEVNGHGRDGGHTGLDLSRTVGWLAVRHPLRLTVPPKPRSPGARRAALVAQANRVPGDGLGYGLLRYLCPDSSVRERLARARRPEIAFNYLGRYHSGSAAAPGWRWLTDTPELTAADEDREHLLELVAAVVDGELRLNWTYSANRHRESTVRRIAGAHLRHLFS